MIHSPLQGKYPELGMFADYDSAAGRQNAPQDFRPASASRDTIICASHFPAPSTGQVRRWGDGYKFVATASDPAASSDPAKSDANLSRVAERSLIE